MADTGLLCIIGVGGDPRYRSCCKPGKLTHPWGNKTPNIPSRSHKMLTYSSELLQSVKSETAGGLSDSESHQEKGNSLYISHLHSTPRLKYGVCFPNPQWAVSKFSQPS